MREYLVVFLVAVAVTYVLAVLARESAMRVGAYARVRDRDVHAIPIPYFGGIAMLLGLLAAYLVASQMPFLSRSEDAVLSDAGAVMVGATVITVVGVIDDMYELDALTKFAGQVLAAVITVSMGVQLVYLPLPGTTWAIDPLQSILFSVLTIVICVNAVNFVDGLDGLAAGVAGIGAVSFFIFAFVLVSENRQTNAIAAAMLCAALAGVCAGILPHNFNPARMFIGDAGAMLLGFVLACSAISLSGRFSAAEAIQGLGGAQASLFPALLPLLLPFAVLLVPFVDMLMAVVRRTRAGRSPFAPDKLHMHHRLLEIGHSHRRAVLVMYMISGVVAFGAVALGLIGGWRAVAGVAVMVVVTALAVFWLPRAGRPRSA
ncbi:undecaprenyl/decaprenyl-phosphate alpha-N-acetylglucosaminyl 1-phosphate transferase [Mumia sp. zg.B21]|uniref:MraY family glycosyltransferase n=1 Tax=unclassified Mumia TaxID=2621872 RepID=UPI001C6DD964|nr:MULTISPECIES: MraY family glycosyltransferase [unclassified Mumia]MBW9211110.1 undecaprenyl/decaprenyl-phosphate alpha-N-acetylglucosaminyl 1-phosphate transferase [Mumia sp. zg.B21]MDD9347840.1 MraY family glycosyltransferase [Mumia sp.]